MYNISSECRTCPSSSLLFSFSHIVTKNTFTSDNFLYNITATNGGPNKDYSIVPRETTFVADQVAIAPGATQSYDFTFKLKGINADQNFDQGKTFAGYFQVYLIDSAAE